MTFDALTPETLDAAAARIFAQDEEVPDATPGEEPPPEEGETQAGDADEDLDGGAPETPEQDEPAPEGPGEPEAEPEPGPAPPTAAAFHFADLGVTVDEGQARNYALFERYLQDNPEVAAVIAAQLAGSGQATPPTAGTPTPQAPPELDMEDPRDRFFAEQLTALAQSQSALAQHVVEREQAIADANARAIVEGAVDIFTQGKDLSADDVNEIRTIAGRIQLPPDAHLNPTAAVINNLEQAYWAIPRFREKVLADERARVAEDRKRQRKLAAVTGTSGSVSRTPPEPRNETERKDALRKAVYELWQGNAVNE